MNSEVKPGRGEEWFDVVNERDEVVGRQLQRIVHAQGLWHRAVHVLVFDARGQVFLQKRSMLKDLSPGRWDSSCSGHVDSGEDYDLAAQRELGEEIGVTMAQPPERWFRLNACEQTGWEFVWVYRLRHDGPFVLHPDEIETGDWFPVEEVTRWMAERPGDFCPSFNLLWPMVAARL
jgi:isopentenyl-diphosphate delta-isomerase